MTRTLRVLVVEDNPADADLIREMLRDPGQVLLTLVFVQRLAEALEILPKTPVDLVLLDLGLPDSRGLDTLGRLQEAAADLPVVVLTGNSDQDLGSAAVKAGAQDYFVKGLATGGLLGRAMLYAVERKQAQAALLASAVRYHRLFEASLDGILLVDADTGVILDANPVLLAMMGHPRDALIQKSIWETAWLKGVLADPDKLAELWRGALVRYDCVPLVTSNGRTIDVEFVSNIYSVGRQKLIQCNLRDITVRVRASEALRQSEEWHRLLFAGSRDALMTIEPPAWNYSSGNPAAIAMFGLRDETDLLTRTPGQCSPATQPSGSDSEAEIARHLESALRDGSRFFEWTHRRAGGEAFPATVLLARMDIGDRVFLQATVRDETEKQRLQASVAQADRLSSMGMLAAGVAHEINNPLSYLLYNVETLAADLPGIARAVSDYRATVHDRLGEAGFADLGVTWTGLLQPSMLEDAAERAREALVGARRIKEVTRGLGTFARVEGAERSAVHLNYSIECAINLCFNEIKYRARLVKDFAQLPPVVASEGKLVQVFLNLLMNAAHAIGDGHVEGNRIGVRTWCEGSRVFAEVTDTGGGIPPENLDRIFEPFFTTKTAGVGSGLGLSICRNIVSEFGGEIQAESEPGQGARFVVSLPVMPDTPQAPRDRAKGPTERIPGVRGRILVVDDEEEQCRMLRRMLESDHEVITVASGEEGQALLRKDRSFDLILCDLMMPRMSGMELHAWLVGSDPVTAGRVVFLTGGAFTPKAAEYLANVKNLRIDKPVESSVLTAAVMNQIRENRKLRPPVAAGGRTG